VDLSEFDNNWYDPGRPFAVRAIWHILNSLILQNPLFVHSSPKRGLLRLFGAKIGRGVVIKPKVNVTYPWNVEIGDNAWIGEEAWLHSLTKVHVGRNACVSQRCLLSTGSHDVSDPFMGLIVKPIVIEDCAWVGADSFVGLGVTISDGAVAGAGSNVVSDLPPWTICVGNPCRPVKERLLRRTTDHETTDDQPGELHP